VNLRGQLDDAASAVLAAKDVTRGASAGVEACPIDPRASLPAVANHACREVGKRELHMPQRMPGTRGAEFAETIDFGFSLDPIIQFAPNRESAALRPKIRGFRNHAAPFLGRNGCHTFRTN